MGPQQPLQTGSIGPPPCQSIEHRSSECLLCMKYQTRGEGWLLKNKIWFSVYWRDSGYTRGQLGSSAELSCGAGHGCSVLRRERCSGHWRRQDHPEDGEMKEKEESEFPREFQETERLGVPIGWARSWGAWRIWAMTRWPRRGSYRRKNGFLELNQQVQSKERGWSKLEEWMNSSLASLFSHSFVHQHSCVEYLAGVSGR